MLLPGSAFPRSATIRRRLHIDDLVILAMFHFSRLHLKDDFAAAQRADTLVRIIGFGGSPRRNVGQHSNTRCAESTVRRKAVKAGIRLGTSSIVDASHGDGGRAWTLRA